MFLKNKNTVILLLAVFFICIRAESLNVYSQLISAQAENKASDYSVGTRGRFWFNTASEHLRFDDGSAIRTLVTTNNSQTLTNKTIDADSNTITNIENADIKSGAAIARSKIASEGASRVVINDASGFLSHEATLAVSRGGTNTASYTRGDIIYASEATTLLKLPIGASGQVLKVTTGLPAWGSAASSLALAAKTANYTLTSTDDFVSGDASGASFTFTLPAAASNSGKVFDIKRIDSTVANTITIDGNASETIDGALTYVLRTQYQAVKIVSDGSNWHILNRSRNDNVVFLETGSGHGDGSHSTVRRFSSCSTNGTAITVTSCNDATNGSVITINEAGIYSMCHRDARGAGAADHGISINSSGLTTNIQSLANTQIGCSITNGSGGTPLTCCATRRLAASDVIRAQDDGNNDQTTNAFIRVEKIGDY